MTELWHLSRDCKAVCSPGRPAMCDDRECCCECHDDVEPQCPCEAPGSDHPGDCIGATCPRIPPLTGSFGPGAERARELDNRPANKLAVIAGELAAERYGDMTAERLRTLAELQAERYGRPRRGAA